MISTMSDQNDAMRRARLRRRDWWIAGAVYTGSAVAGGWLAFGILRKTGPALSPTVVTLWVALATIGYALGNWLYWRAMDEVEIRDNVIGAVAGIHVYMIALPAWWLLWKGGVTEAPNPWAIWFASLGSFAVIYLFRRMRTYTGS